MKRSGTSRLAAGMMLMSVCALGGCDVLSGLGMNQKAEVHSDLNSVIPRLMGQDWAAKDAVTVAAELFNVTSADERRDAIAYLSTQSYGHYPPYIKAYTFLTTDPSPMVRAQACRALGGARSAEVVPTLLGKGTRDGGVKDKEAIVRADAALALYESFTDEAIDPLISLLQGDPEPTVRSNAARALVRTREQRAVKALIDALEDRNALVVRDAYSSLWLVTGAPIDVDQPRMWLEWYQNQPWNKPAATATEPAKQGG